MKTQLEWLCLFLFLAIGQSLPSLCTRSRVKSCPLALLLVMLADKMCDYMFMSLVWRLLKQNDPIPIVNGWYIVSLKLLRKTEASNGLGGSASMETEQKTILTSSCYCPKCRTLRLLPPKNFLIPKKTSCLHSNAVSWAGKFFSNYTSSSLLKSGSFTSNSAHSLWAHWTFRLFLSSFLQLSWYW